MSLIDLLELPGNVWLVDLPGNGDNTQNIPAEFDFDTWFPTFQSVIPKFKNPILVGHSFGGMFPLCFPELENELKGFVILNSAPCLPMEEAVAYAKNYDVPDLTKEMEAFVLNPNNDTFRDALNACLPYYFPKQTLELGKALLANVPFQFMPAVWWQRKAVEMQFSAKWIPENIPTLILSGTYDCIVPHYLFERDLRFQRKNIEMKNIEEGGHMPWIENPEVVKAAFEKFCVRLNGAKIVEEKMLGDKRAAE